jgi:hypothetical protein
MQQPSNNIIIIAKKYSFQMKWSSSVCQALQVQFAPLRATAIKHPLHQVSVFNLSVDTTPTIPLQVPDDCERWAILVSKRLLMLDAYTIA